MAVLQESTFGGHGHSHAEEHGHEVVEHDDARWPPLFVFFCFVLWVGLEGLRFLFCFVGWFRGRIGVMRRDLGLVLE